MRLGRALSRRFERATDNIGKTKDPDQHGGDASIHLGQLHSDRATSKEAATPPDRTEATMLLQDWHTPLTRTTNNASCSASIPLYHAPMSSREFW